MQVRNERQQQYFADNATFESLLQYYRVHYSSFEKFARGAVLFNTLLSKQNITFSHHLSLNV